jgi:hypothetical protein
MVLVMIVLEVVKASIRLLLLLFLGHLACQMTVDLFTPQSYTDPVCEASSLNALGRNVSIGFEPAMLISLLSDANRNLEYIDSN